jgi:hypothetical protein
MNLKKSRSTRHFLQYAGVCCSSLLVFAAIAAPLAGRAIAQVRPSAPVVNPPLPSEQQPPIVILTPSNGTAGVKLINKTGAQILYQVIGDTRLRVLNGRSEITLQSYRLLLICRFIAAIVAFCLYALRCRQQLPIPLS